MSLLARVRARFRDRAAPWPAGGPATPASALLDGPAVGELRARATAGGWQPFGPLQTCGQLAGEQPSPFVGQGLEFEELRPYQPGDDVRSIDWQATARLRLPHVRVFREERMAARHLLVDRGPGMRFATHGRLKAAQAAAVAVALLCQGQAAGRRLGLTLVDERLHLMPAGAGEGHLGSLLEAVRAGCPPLAAARGRGELDRGLRVLEQQLPRRGAEVAILADFHELGEAGWRALRRLASGHRVLAVRILDPAEWRLPRLGRGRFVAPGGGPEQAVDTGDRRLRAELEGAVRERGERLARLLRQGGGGLVELSTEDDVSDCLEAIAVHG